MNILDANISEAGYGKKVVLKNIKFSVDEGEIVGLIGPNGAGKSTLLKVIIGILNSDRSEIVFQSKSITGKTPEQRVRMGISFIPQGNRVFTELSVRENLEVGGYLLNGKKEIEDRIQSILRLFPDLHDRMKQSAGMLSGGEKQQLALVRALMLKPKLLLMDEPSLGLSPRLVIKAMDMIQGINRELKTTIVIVEQKVHEIIRIASRICGLRMGQVVFAGSPDELKDEAQLRQIFLSGRDIEV